MTKYLQTKRNSIEEAISSVVLDEKFSITLPPVRGGKKLLNIEMGRAIRMLKDFGATKSDIRNVLSGKGGRFQNANGEMFLVQRESVELGEAMSKDMAKKILSLQKGQSFSKIASGDMVPMVYLSGDERDQLKKEFGRLSRDVPNRDKGITVPNLINLAKTGNPTGDYDTEAMVNISYLK